MKNFAFTLAEVLITLGIIGVVAAMTLPTIIANYQEKVLVERLKQTYSIFSQAYLMAINNNGPSEFWDIGHGDTADGAQKLYNMFKPYLLKSKDCDTQQGCFADNYKSLFGESYIWQPKTHPYYARGILSNGVSFIFWSNGTGCPDNKCGVIKVDINGLQKPNKAGVDYFDFKIYTNNIFPSYFSSPTPIHGEFCKYNDKSNKNGVVCTGLVISKGNMDYLRRDVSNEF